MCHKYSVPLVHKQHDALMFITVQQLTSFQLVAVLNMLPKALLGQGLPLAGHMAGLCSGLLKHQAAAVVPYTTHHVQPTRRPCHYDLLLQPPNASEYNSAGQGSLCAVVSVSHPAYSACLVL